LADIPRSDLDVFGDDFLGDPYAFHPQLRDAGPVVWLERYGIYAMARFAEVSASLKDYETFASSRGVGLSDFAREEPWRPPSLLLETDPPVHDRTRGLMNRIVSPQAIKKRIPLWADHAHALVDRALAKGHIDAVTEIAEVYPMTVFPDTIGLPVEGRESLLAYAAAAFNAFGPRNALFETSQSAARDSMKWVAGACRRASLTDGGWGMDVFRAADAGDCTEEEAERLVRSFLSAGVDTTVNGIGNMLHAFATHPEQWARLRADRSL